MFLLVCLNLPKWVDAPQRQGGQPADPEQEMGEGEQKMGITRASKNDPLTQLQKINNVV